VAAPTGCHLCYAGPPTAVPTLELRVVEPFRHEGFYRVDPASTARPAVPGGGTVIRDQSAKEMVDEGICGDG